MTRSLIAISLSVLVLTGVTVAGLAQNLIILDVEDDTNEITFTAPLSTDDPVLEGRSLAELIEGQPLFAPIEGLPEEVWSTLNCNGCHQWDQTTLCTQAQFYLSEAGRTGLGKVHPYGGGFKQAIRSWGAQGCE